MACTPACAASAGRIEVGLADAEVEHVLAGGLPALRLIADGDGLGGLEVLDVDRQRVGHAAGSG